MFVMTDGDSVELWRHCKNVHIRTSGQKKWEEKNRMRHQKINAFPVCFIQHSIVFYRCLAVWLSVWLSVCLAGWLALCAVPSKELLMFIQFCSVYHLSCVCDFILIILSILFSFCSLCCVWFIISFLPPKISRFSSLLFLHMYFF